VCWGTTAACAATLTPGEVLGVQGTPVLRCAPAPPGAQPGRLAVLARRVVCLMPVPVAVPSRSALADGGPSPHPLRERMPARLPVPAPQGGAPAYGYKQGAFPQRSRVLLATRAVAGRGQDGLCARRRASAAGAALEEALGEPRRCRRGANRTSHEDAWRMTTQGREGRPRGVAGLRLSRC
jgi:hypothetical protein